MRQVSLLMFLGPAAVLYLVTDVASARGTLSALGALLAALALSLAFAPFLWRPGSGSGAGAAGLGLCFALSLVRLVDGVPLRLSADLALLVGLCGSGALLLDLALRVPEPLPHLRRWPALLPSALLFALSGCVLGVELLSLGPALGCDRVDVLPPYAGRFAAAFWLGAAALALALRLLRRALPITAESRADNDWALLGLWPANLAWMALLGALVIGGTPSAALTQPLSHHGGKVWALLWAGICICLTICHAQLGVPGRGARVGWAIRRAVSAALTAGVVFACGGVLFVHLPDTFSAGGQLAILTTTLAALCYRPITRVLDRFLAPARGRLLDALAAVSAQRLQSAHHLPDFMGLVLNTMRAACYRDQGTFGPLPRGRETLGTGDVRMYLLSPAQEAVLDAAGQVHLRRRALSPVIEAELRRVLGRPLIRGQLCALQVRAPRLRPLIEVLEELDLLCVLPLVVDGELEGALLLPRAGRRQALALEELQALSSFTAVVASQLVTLAAAGRAHVRAQRAGEYAQSLRGRCQELQGELLVLRAQLKALSALPGVDVASVPLVHYSPAMRGLLAQVGRLSSDDQPVLWVAESGVAVALVAGRMHALSPRRARPLLIFDCDSIPTGQQRAFLLGVEDDPLRPGALQLARGGTLLLLNLLSLELSAQTALADALVTGLARPEQASPAAHRPPAYAVDCWLLASARCDLREPTASGRCHMGLSRQFGTRRLRVPPLRDRAQDLEALLLAALGRACARLGRPALGFEPEAMALLRRYRWPGNELELEQCVEHAVRSCRTARVRVSDLWFKIEQRSHRDLNLASPRL